MPDEILMTRPMPDIAAAKKWFLAVAWAYVRTWYRWGGDDPGGMDCSGLALEALKSIGAVGEYEDLTADQIMKRFIGRKRMRPEEGAMMFRLDTTGKAVHVVICIDEYHHIGADGGSSTVTSAEDAAKQNAFVKVRPNHFDPSRHVVISLF